MELRSPVVKGSQFMATDKIRVRIEELRAPVAKEVLYDQARWLKELQRCAFVDPRQFFDAEGNAIAIPALSDEAAPAMHRAAVS